MLLQQLGGHRNVQAVLELLERMQGTDAPGQRPTALAFRRDLPLAPLRTAAQAGRWYRIRPVLAQDCWLRRGAGAAGGGDVGRADAASECPICADELGAVGGSAVRLSCKHMYHPACLSPWLEKVGRGLGRGAGLGHVEDKARAGAGVEDNAPGPV